MSSSLLLFLNLWHHAASFPLLKILFASPSLTFLVAHSTRCKLLENRGRKRNMLDSLVINKICFLTARSWFSKGESCNQLAATAIKNLPLGSCRLEKGTGSWGALGELTVLVVHWGQPSSVNHRLQTSDCESEGRGVGDTFQWWSTASWRRFWVSTVKHYIALMRS